MLFARKRDEKQIKIMVEPVWPPSKLTGWLLLDYSQSFFLVVSKQALSVAREEEESFLAKKRKKTLQITNERTTTTNHSPGRRRF